MLNPHLGETLREVFQLLAATLLRINRLAYIAPCLLQARALHAKLRQVQAQSVGMKAGQLSEIEEEVALKAATLAAALAVERHYVRRVDGRNEGGPTSPMSPAALSAADRLSYDPRYLIFEFTTSIILRETQALAPLAARPTTPLTAGHATLASSRARCRCDWWRSSSAR